MADADRFVVFKTLFVDYQREVVNNGAPAGNVNRAAVAIAALEKAWVISGDILVNFLENVNCAELSMNQDGRQRVESLVVNNYISNAVKDLLELEKRCSALDVRKQRTLQKLIHRIEFQDRPGPLNFRARNLAHELEPRAVPLLR